MRVSLLITCLVDVFEPDVADAAVRVLEAGGCEVTCSMDQTCCGQPAWNSGFAEESARVARTTLQALEAELEDGAERVVVPAGSCATMIRIFWRELFEVVGDHDAAERARRVGERTVELSELASTLDLPPLRLGRDVAVAYHHSCHMLRELHLHDPPVELLERIGGVDRRPWPADERCCGFGGMFSFKLPETSTAMADDKLSTLAETDAEVLIGSDSSCLMHLRGRAAAEGKPVHTRHLAEVIAAALPAEDAS